ncbi:MAG: hypothetical protein AAGL98_04385, partial [Planctomycetota bacterium]
MAGRAQPLDPPAAHSGAMLETARQFVADHANWFTALAIASAGTLVLSLLALPVVAVLLPADFVVRKLDPAAAPRPTRRRHPVRRTIVRLLKNTAGGVLAVAGLAMLILPGQGLLTLALAFLLLDLPGKARLEARLLNHKK